MHYHDDPKPSSTECYYASEEYMQLFLLSGYPLRAHQPVESHPFSL